MRLPVWPCLSRCLLLLMLVSLPARTWASASLSGMGRNNQNQLGDGTTINRFSPVEIQADGIGAVAAGENHSLFIKTDGSLWAMGNNGDGQLGDGSNLTRSTPVQILASGVTQVAAGGRHSLFVKADGSLWAMGFNGNGQLGDGTTISRSAPVQILASGVAQVAAGLFHSFFIKTDGSLWAMGHNGFSQLGDGTNTGRSTPVQIRASGVAQASAGQFHSLFRLTSGALLGMGWNGHGQLGDNSTTDRATPVTIQASGVLKMAAGGSHSMFIKADGSLWAMGANANRQLGDESITERHSPVQIHASEVAQVAAGKFHSLFVKNDGSLWVMGDGGNGQLGDDAIGHQPFRDTPVAIVLSEVLAVVAGAEHSLFLVQGDELPGIHAVTPSQSALGVTLTVTGLELTAKSVQAKLVQAAPPAGKKPKSYTLTVVKGSLSDTQVQLIAKTGKPGLYHLDLYRRGVKAPYRLTEGLTLKVPALAAVNPTEARRQQVVTLTGSHFGLPKGTVTLQLGKKKTRVKVTAWTDTSISFAVPKKQKTGLYAVLLKNKLGTMSAADALTVIE